MAVLKIDSINYMSAGTKGVTFNLDYSEVQSREAHANDNQMTGDEPTRKSTNQTFVLENKNAGGITTEKSTEGSFSNESKLNVSPLYDIVDLTIKSKFRNPGRFTKHIDPRRNKEINLDDDHVEVFSAKMDSQPIGFTNFSDGNCYLLTESTTNNPRVKRTTLENNIVNNEQNEFYSYEVTDLATHVVLYPTEGPGGDIESRATSIRNNPDNAENCFQMKTDIIGVKSNYLHTIEQNEECHPFENGDIYGTTRRTKNAYNAMYSMEMPNENELKSCRDYCGIGTCGSRIYLKYYDNQNYSLTTGKTKGTATEKTASASQDGYPFQKVEVIDELDYLDSDAKHKSSIFSVRIRNTGLGDGDAGIQDASIRDKLKKDIANTVRTLAEQTCPANTTLFDVYFED